jgi:hypothetical protein
MARPLLIIATLLALSLALTAPAKADGTAEKLRHYCTNWGSAGLYPDDERALADNPMSKLQIQMPDGTVFEFMLLYIFKGYELDESPKEWQQIWDGFAKVCPGWPKPEWLVKLEAWKAQSRPREDPRVARQKRRIAELTADAEQRESRASELRTKVLGSAAYQQITGGNDNWYAEAERKEAYLEQVVSLAATRYVIVGKVDRRVPEGVWVTGVAVAPKVDAPAPGTRTSPVQLFVAKPGPGWARTSGDFFAADALLLGLPNQQNPQVVFGTSLPAETSVAVKRAGAELREIAKILKTGKKKIGAMLKPVERLEADAARLRSEAERLQAELGRR